MSKKPDGVEELVKDFEYRGGMAFPFVVPHAGTHEIFPGMSLLDWFAGQALAGMFASDVSRDWTISVDGEPGRAELAYKMAKAMLKAREEEMNDRGSD